MADKFQLPDALSPDQLKDILDNRLPMPDLKVCRFHRMKTYKIVAQTKYEIHEDLKFNQFNWWEGIGICSKCGLIRVGVLLYDGSVKLSRDFGYLPDKYKIENLDSCEATYTVGRDWVQINTGDFLTVKLLNFGPEGLFTNLGRSLPPNDGFSLMDKSIFSPTIRLRTGRGTAQVKIVATYAKSANERKRFVLEPKGQEVKIVTEQVVEDQKQGRVKGLVTE